MKNILYLFCCITLMSACSSSKKITGQNNSILSGIWSEHWEKTGSVTDVTYVDTLKINAKDKVKISVKCLNNKNYQYSKGEWDGQHFTFTMENTSDPREQFLVHYTLTPINDKLLKGYIINSRDKRIEVELKRVK